MSRAMSSIAKLLWFLFDTAPLQVCRCFVRNSATSFQTRLADPRRCCWVWHKKYLTIWRFLVSQSTHRWRSTLKWQRQSGVVIFIYSHSLRQLRSSLPHDVAQSVASAIIGSRLDYCNCTTACQTRTSRGYRECRMLLLELFAKIHDANLTQPSFLRIGYRCVAESTTRLLSSVIKPSNCNNLRVLLVYSRHTDSRVFWGYPRQTYFQHSLHRQTRLLVGSHAALPPFGTVSFICTLRWQFH